MVKICPSKSLQPIDLVISPPRLKEFYEKFKITPDGCVEADSKEEIESFIVKEVSDYIVRIVRAPPWSKRADYFIKRFRKPKRTMSYQDLALEFDVRCPLCGRRVRVESSKCRDEDIEYTIEKAKVKPVACGGCECGALLRVYRAEDLVSGDFVICVQHGGSTCRWYLAPVLEGITKEVIWPDSSLEIDGDPDAVLPIVFIVGFTVDVVTDEITDESGEPVDLGYIVIVATRQRLKAADN